MFGLGMQEMIIVGIVAVLLFGKRLPEVARSLGGSYNQFRKGLQEIQSEMSGVSNAYYSSSYTNKSYSGTSTSSPYGSSATAEDEEDQPTAPKFEPPPSEPLAGDAALIDPAGQSTASDSLIGDAGPRDVSGSGVGDGLGSGFSAGGSGAMESTAAAAASESAAGEPRHDVSRLSSGQVS